LDGGEKNRPRQRAEEMELAPIRHSTHRNTIGLTWSGICDRFNEDFGCDCCGECLFYHLWTTFFSLKRDYKKKAPKASPSKKEN